MTTLLVILGILAAIVILPTFGLGLFAGLASGALNFLKGVFGAGFGCAKTCLGILALLIVMVLAVLLMSLGD